MSKKERGTDSSSAASGGGGIKQVWSNVVVMAVIEGFNLLLFIEGICRFDRTRWFGLLNLERWLTHVVKYHLFF